MTPWEQRIALIVFGDDDNGTGLDAALEYTVTKPGDYLIEVFACCGGRTSGSYKLMVGINAPQVLDGSGEATGDILVNTGAARKLGIPSNIETLTGYLKGRHSHYYEVVADENEIEDAILYATARTTSGNGTPQLHLIEVSEDVTLSDVLEKEGQNHIATGETVEDNLKAVRLNSDPQQPLEAGHHYFIEVNMAQAFESENPNGRVIGDYELTLGLTAPILLVAKPLRLIRLPSLSRFEANSSVQTRQPQIVVLKRWRELFHSKQSPSPRRLPPSFRGSRPLPCVQWGQKTRCVSCLRRIELLMRLA